MDRIDKIITKESKISPSESLRGLLINSMSNQEEIGPPKGYYYLTSLCNPVQDFLKRIYPKIKQKTNPEQEKTRVRGNKIHRFAEIWIQNMDKFFSSESNLDGFFIGIRTTGRIDAKVDNHILEFKSKKRLPFDINEIIERYPHDLEQLAFYSVIDPSCSNENYLIFISQDIKQEMKVFKITTKNKEEIIKILKQRINLLDGAQKKHVPAEKLGKCRFCNEYECVFLEKDLCVWKNNYFPCGVLDFIKIEEDHEFKKKLSFAKSQWNKKSELFRINDLISARGVLYCNSLEKMEDDWTEPIEKTLAKDYASNITFNFIKQHGEKISEVPSPKIKEIKKHKLWLRLKTSKDVKGKIAPYVVGASLTNNEWYLRYPPSYKVMELGLVCAIYGKSKGYVFEYLPNLDVKFRAYEVSFESPEKIVKEINRILNILQLNDINKFKELPLCPDFFCKNCSIKEYCDKETNKLS